MGWRNAGRLCWWPVKKDDYPWKEDLHETAWLQNYGPSEQKPKNATRRRSANVVGYFWRDGSIDSGR